VSIPTSCSTCELHVVKNLDLAKCVGHLQDENDKLREVLSWLSSQEPQPGMMIASCKRFDGWTFGSDKVGEISGEREGKFGNVPVPPQSTPKDKFASKPNQLLKPRAKPSEKASEKPSEKTSGKPSEEPHPKPKPRPISIHCEYCGKDGHKKEFCYKSVDGKNSFNVSIGLASVQVTYALLHLREIPRFVNPQSKRIAST
jgi:hypothetical protein